MIVADTGPFVAIIDADDADHQRCVDWYSRLQEPLIIPAPIITEICYMIGRVDAVQAFRAEAAFLREIAQSPRLQIACLEDRDLLRMANLVEKYGDFPLGGADASVIAVAERLGITKIATLDVRHFGVVRPKHVSAFTLLP